VSDERRPRTAAATRSRQRRATSARASATFAALLLAFIVYSFVFAPQALPEFKQRLLAFACAMTAGLMGFFLTGSLGLNAATPESKAPALPVRATGGFAAFALVLLWWISPLAPVKTSDEPGGVFRVRATILDPGGLPVDEAIVWSSVGGEAKRVSGGWQLDIPASTRPADGKLTVYASKAPAFLQGQTDLILDADPNPTLVIQLRKDDSARVTGRVLDASSNPVPHAWIHVVGHEQERVQTGAAGEFVLAAHAAKGEMIRLRADKAGFRSEELVHAAGGESATIVLSVK
jgi:hypothetical protein